MCSLEVVIDSGSLFEIGLPSIYIFGIETRKTYQAFHVVVLQRGRFDVVDLGHCAIRLLGGIIRIISLSLPDSENVNSLQGEPYCQRPYLL